MARGRKRAQERRAKGSGSLFKRKDGRYVASIQLGYEAGRRQRVYFYSRSEQECVDWLNEKLHEKRQGRLRMPSRQTVAQFIERWLSDVVKPNLRPKSHEDYENVCRRYLVPELGTRRLEKLAAQDVAEMLARLAERGLSKSTVMLSLAVLKSALSVAVRWGLVGQNVAKLVDPPRMAQQQTRVLTAEEVAALYRAAEGDRLGAMYVLAVSAGLRRGELLGLRWEDLDLDGGYVTVRRQLQRIREQGLSVGETKSAAGERVEALPASTVAALRRHRVKQKEERVGRRKWDDTGYVFTNQSGGTIEPDFVSPLFHALLTRAGLPPMPFQVLRRTHSTLLAEAGVSDTAISKRLGHSGTAVTRKHYIKATDPMDRQAAQVWDALVKEG